MMLLPARVVSHLFAGAAALALAAPAFAPPAAQDLPPAEAADAVEHPEGVTGTWYAQKMEGQWVAPEAEYRLEFRDDGTAHFFENGEAEDESIPYTVDTERSVITLTESDIGMVFELAYIQFDDVMIVTIRLPEELRGLPVDEQEMEIVLSRRPEGNADHQRERAALAPGTGRGAMGGGQAAELTPQELTLMNLEELAYFAEVFSDDEGAYPQTLGALQEYIGSADLLVQPGQADALPEDWGGQAGEERAAWIDGHTGYGYIGGDAATLAYKKERWDTVLLFELPLHADTETIALITVGYESEVLDYDEADALIAAQTGRDLMAWMEYMGREQLPPREEAEGDDAGGDTDEASPPRDGGHFHADGTYEDGVADSPDDAGRE